MKRNKRSNHETHTIDEPMELLPFLLSVMENRSRNSVKSILTRGQVSVDDDLTTKHNYQLKPGQTVMILKNKVAAKVNKMIGLSIIHEDKDIIVINKDAGLLSIASAKEKDLTAHSQLMDYVRIANPKNRIFVVHRLDRDTSGVMVFAKNEKVKRTLQDNWKRIVKERTYTAIVDGTVKKPEGTITSWLKESSTLVMYSSPKEGDGLRAVTHYQKQLSNKHFSLLKVNLETGRKNQIRVHMNDIGHPVVGDKKYGSNTNAIGRLGLHASVLAFEHPGTGKLLRFEADVPDSFMRKFK
ncbi:RluA family pseudouridine synthase [Virgibacillus necropolis]|uniref:Pseudouridine synthase n=1 Tax=Virgibacillus necropolis TaxID=163877 RepID=A0A221MH01_9BACI|nr:RluA family pseudouridine synthase [Virgibacillus necropolis]ASN06943.1 RNA pseudouridine synthase [Virgibacillus necropolis]